MDLGDKEWIPRDCTLRILEGPELAGPDLRMGRAWDNAERASEDVTRRLVDEATAPVKPVVAILAADTEAADEVGVMLRELGGERVAWADLRARILAPAREGTADPDAAPVRYAALLVVGSAEPPPPWFFDAGLARGALGAGAPLVQVGQGSIPESLAGLDVMRLQPGDETSLRALGERLGLTRTER